MSVYTTINRGFTPHRSPVYSQLFYTQSKLQATTKILDLTWEWQGSGITEGICKLIDLLRKWITAKVLVLTWERDLKEVLGESLEHQTSAGQSHLTYIAIIYWTLRCNTKSPTALCVLYLLWKYIEFGWLTFILEKCHLACVQLYRHLWD